MSEHVRFQYDDNGTHLDEIVLTGVTFHIERMSQHGWWLGVDDPETGQHLSMWWAATAEPVVEEDFADVRHYLRGPLLYHAPPWRDRKGGEHRCEIHGDHKLCRCECGATTTNDNPPADVPMRAQSNEPEGASE